MAPGRGSNGRARKVRQPEVPASTTVVTPLRNECASTWTLLSRSIDFSSGRG